MAVSFIAASTGQVETAAATVTHTITSALANDMLLIQVLCDGTGSNAPATQSGSTNFQSVTGGSAASVTQLNGTEINQFSPQDSSFSVGSPSAARHFLAIARVIADGNAVVVLATASGDDHYSRVYSFRGVSTSTNFNNVIENSGGGSVAQDAQTSTTVSDVGVTTAAAGALACNAVAINDDATGLAAFAGETGGDWTLAAAVYESSTGTDGTIALMIADMASAGTINGGSDAITSDGWSVVGWAFTAAVVAFVPRHPAANHQNPALV